MKHLKKHIKRLHKIQIHPNRWLVWAVAITFVSAVILVSYIKVTDSQFEQMMADPSYLRMHGSYYKDNFLGFAALYPKNWGIEADGRNIINFIDPYNFGDGITVSVFESDDEQSIRRSLDIASENKVTIGGSDGVHIVANIESDSTEDVFMVVNNDRLYVIRGNTHWIGYMVSSFIFISETT